MSKKDFIALADSLKAFNAGAGWCGFKPFDENQIASLANFCQAQNPNFKRDRWLSYIAGECGPNGGTIKS